MQIELTEEECNDAIDTLEEGSWRHDDHHFRERYFRLMQKFQACRNGAGARAESERREE